MSEPPVDVLRNAPRKTAALLHIATHPGASNRAIAAGIGIADEAQISRLLALMQDLGGAGRLRAPVGQGRRSARRAHQCHGVLDARLAHLLGRDLEHAGDPGGAASRPPPRPEPKDGMSRDLLSSSAEDPRRYQTVELEEAPDGNRNGT
jgi:hypothetical protein